MSIGIIGKKIGMTRVFDEDGVSTPVTVVEVEVNRITQIKTLESDGYSAVQVTTGSVHAGRVSKPKSGVFAKAGVEAGRGLWEFRADSVLDMEGLEVGGELTVERFSDVAVVDVTGTTKGKGFQGGIKRHNFTMQDATHMVTLFLIDLMGRLVKTKRLDVFLKARKCLVIWVMFVKQHRTWI